MCPQQPIARLNCKTVTSCLTETQITFDETHATALQKSSSAFQTHNPTQDLSEPQSEPSCEQEIETKNKNFEVPSSSENHL